jgi:hypothetical protein
LHGQWNFGFGLWFSLYPASIVILMNHKALLFPGLEFKEYVVNPDAEMDFSGLDIYLCLDVP